MSRRRRSTWKKLTLLALVAAGATATVAVAQTGGAFPAGALSLYSFALDMPSPGGMPGAAQAETPATPPAETKALARTRPVERCTRYASLTLAAAQGIRQGRVEETGDHMTVIGRLKGQAVRMTIAGAADDCRVVRVEGL